MKVISRIMGISLIIFAFLIAITAIMDSDYSLDILISVLSLIAIGFFLLKIVKLKILSRILGISLILIGILSLTGFFIDNDLTIVNFLLAIGFIISGVFIFIDYEKKDKDFIENKFNSENTEIKNTTGYSSREIKNNYKNSYDFNTEKNDKENVINHPEKTDINKRIKSEEELKYEKERKLKKGRMAELHILIVLTILYLLTLLLLFILFIYAIAGMKMNLHAFVLLLLFATLQILFIYLGYFSRIKFFYLFAGISYAIPIPIIYMNPGILWEFSKIYMVIYGLYVFVCLALFFKKNFTKIGENFLKF